LNCCVASRNRSLRRCVAAPTTGSAFNSHLLYPSWRGQALVVGS
jgi:hypothetical protein